MRDDELFELLIYDISYFSGKMQAYLRYKEVPHSVREVLWTELASELVEEAGVMEVPLLRRPDGALMRDTTSMILWLEQRFRAPPVLPEDPALAFLMRLLEDYADEGLWRPALYYRWAFDTDAKLYARRFLQDFLKLPGIGGHLKGAQRALVIARQRRVYLTEEGVTDANRSAVEQHYLDELHDLENLLSDRAFLLGERPCLVDFGYFASMFRHFSIDPTPSKIMRNRAPAVYAWVARMWNTRATSLADRDMLTWDAFCDESTIGSILSRVGGIYLPYLHANAITVAAGDRRFDVELDGHIYPGLPAVPFRAWSRHILLREYSSLSEGDRARVDGLLQPTGCLETLLQDRHLEHCYPEGDRLPECLPRTVGRLSKLRLLLTGTPHHLEAGKRR